MKAKNIQLTGKERISMQAMIRLELQSNEQCERMGIKPAFETKMLKALYQKLSGHEY